MKSWTARFAFLLGLTTAPSAALSQPPAAGTYVVHAIDVGTGLAVFVEGHDFTLLYDAGSNDDDARGAANRVVAYVRAVRPDLRRIDHVVLSHPHKDHVELMPDVLDTFEVVNLWDSGALNPICSYRNLLLSTVSRGVAYHDAVADGGTRTAAFAAQTCYGRPIAVASVVVPRGSQARRGTTVLLGPTAHMTFLHADGSRQSSFNANSVVVRLTLGSRVILLPGDAEAGGRAAPTTVPSARSIEGQLLVCCRAELRSDILVAGHHGSTTSSRTAFLDAVGASHYVVSSGPTRYGSVTLPDAPVIAEFTRRGTVWATNQNDAACAANPAKIGPDADGRPGGCDNVRIVIDASGTISSGYNRIAD